MAGPTDTAPEAQRVLDEVQRTLPAWRKWALLDDLYGHARSLHAAGVALRRGQVAPEDLRDDWVATHYGPRFLTPRREAAAVDQPNEFRRVVGQVVDAFDRLGIAYALGGSLASSIHGVSRSTIDADLTAEPFPGREAAFVSCFGPDFYVSLDAVRRAVADRSSFNLIQTTTGFKVDVFVRRDRPFEAPLFARRHSFTTPGPDGRTIRVVSAEDVVLLKLERYRLGREVSERQRTDVVNVLRVQAGRLDDAYLDAWAAVLGVADLLARARGEADPG